MVNCESVGFCLLAPFSPKNLAPSRTMFICADDRKCAVLLSGACWAYLVIHRVDIWILEINFNFFTDKSHVPQSLKIRKPLNILIQYHWLIKIVNQKTRYVNAIQEDLTFWFWTVELYVPENRAPLSHLFHSPPFYLTQSSGGALSVLIGLLT